MRYLFLVHEDEGAVSRSRYGAELFAAIGRDARLVSDHRLLASHAATTLLSTHRGLKVSDGPFAAGSEQLSRLCVAELHDLDDALLAGKVLARSAAAVEIRPLWIVR